MSAAKLFMVGEKKGKRNEKERKEKEKHTHTIHRRIDREVQTYRVHR